MKVFAWLAPEDLWVGLVTGVPKSSLPNPREFWDDISAPVMALARDEAAVERAFAELERRSLAERGEVRDGAPSWRIHRMTQAVQRAVIAEAGDPRLRGGDGAGVVGDAGLRGGDGAVGDPRVRGGDGEAAAAGGAGLRGG